MTAPSVIAAEAPYYGISWGQMVEDCLRERGMTNPAFSGTDATLTSASTAQVIQAKACVQEALAYLQDCRSQWWSLSEDDTVAETPYTRAYLPLDFHSFGKGGAFIGGVKLKMLSPEQYAANVRPDVDGGGIVCADVSGLPTHGRVVQATYVAGGITYYRQALDVFPRQAAAWTAHLLYMASAKAITVDTIVVRVPVVLHPIAADLTRANWRKKSGDAKGAAAFLQLVKDALEDVNDSPGDQMCLVAKSGLPTETAQR